MSRYVHQYRAAMTVMPWVSKGTKIIMRSFLVVLVNPRSSPHGKYPRLLESTALTRLNRGDAHPRVTGCKAVYKAFLTLESARKYMTDNQASQYREVIKDTAVDTTPERRSTAYYAVAYGATPGIKSFW
jgi:hypothetical protein